MAASEPSGSLAGHECKYDLLMELDPQEWLQLQLFESKWLEPETLNLYERLLRPGDVFIDVGAHVGFHSLVARHLIGPDGLVVAVEPQPYNAGKLLANWRANGFVNFTWWSGQQEQRIARS